MIDTGLPIADFNSHPDLAALGVAVSLVVGERVRLILGERGIKEVERLEADDKRAWFEQIWFDRNQPQVAAEPSGRQLFFVGGNQDISEYLRKIPADVGKELIDCGPCLLMEYKTQKGFDGFRTVTYFHALGEESGGFPGDNGHNPRLMYNRVRRRLALVGGRYKIKPDGPRGTGGSIFD